MRVRYTVITDFLFDIFGCPPTIILLLASLICPFLPLIIPALMGKSVNLPQNSELGKVFSYILVIAYFIYACYAFMIPQAFIGECGP